MTRSPDEGKPVKQLREEREKRIMDAVQLKIPDRVPIQLELPKGKILARLDTTDIFRAKEILKDHVCLEGNVPSTLLQTGTADDVKAHVKKLIDVIGKGGGYMVSTRSSTDHIKPGNLKALIDCTKEYGVYR